MHRSFYCDTLYKNGADFVLGHFRCEVGLEGAPNLQTGMILNLKYLDSWLAEFARKNLTDAAAKQSLQKISNINFSCERVLKKLRQHIQRKINQMSLKHKLKIMVLRIYINEDSFLESYPQKNHNCTFVHCATQSVLVEMKGKKKMAGLKVPAEFKLFYRSTEKSKITKSFLLKTSKFLSTAIPLERINSVFQFYPELRSIKLSFFGENYCLKTEE